MEYTIAVYTDAGIQKAANQDSLCLRRAAAPDGEVAFCAVCDGMGGLQKGELASAEMIRALEAWFDSNLELLAAALDFTQARSQLLDLIAHQNQRLAAYAAANHVQMGSTLALLLAVGHRYLTVHVGDSRIYQIKGGRAIQLTQDQSLVELEIQQGRISREEARHHPQRNVLLQCVGVGREITPGFTEGSLENEGIYLLCSDGLCHELTDTELAQRLEPQSLGDRRALQDALIDLTERCKTRGETDNITAVAIRCRETAVAEAAPGSFWQRLLGRQPPASPGPPTTISPLESAHILHTDEQIS